MPDNECIDQIEKKLTERRAKLDEAELDRIADRLEQRIYENIGKGVVRRSLWIIGVMTISVATYLKSKGLI